MLPPRLEGRSNGARGCHPARVFGLKLPFTVQNLLQLWVSSPVVGNLSTLEICGAVSEKGTLRARGYYNDLAFSPGSGGSGHPKFTVDGASAPARLTDFDGAWTLGGDTSRATVALTQANRRMETFSFEKGSWTTPPDAWSSGSDTAETVSDA